MSSEVSVSASAINTTSRWLVVLALGLFAVSFVGLRDSAVFLPGMGRGLLPTVVSLLDGEGLEIQPGQPYARRAPLHPILLAPLAALGVTPQTAFRLLGCLAFAATGLGAALLARAAGLSVLRAFATMAAASVLAPTIFLLRIGMADSIAVAAGLFALAALIRYRRDGRIVTLLAALAACSAACLAYYLATVSVAPVVLVALFFAGPASWRRRARDLALYAAVVCLPTGLWLLRNLALTGHVTGMSRTAERWLASTTNPAEHASAIAKTVHLDLFTVDRMALPRLTEQPLVLSVVSVAVTALVVGAGIAALVVGRRLLTNLAYGGSSVAPGCRFAFLLIAGQVLWHFVALLVVWTAGNNDPISTRYVGPIYPTLLVGALGLHALVARPGCARWAAPALAAAGALFLAVQLPKSAALLGNAPGPELMKRSWEESQWFWDDWPRWRSGGLHPRPGQRGSRDRGGPARGLGHPDALLRSPSGWQSRKATSPDV